MQLSNEHGYIYNGRTDGHMSRLPASNSDLETSRQDKTCVNYQAQDKWNYYCDRTILKASEDYRILILWFQASYDFFLNSGVLPYRISWHCWLQGKRTEIQILWILLAANAARKIWDSRRPTKKWLNFCVLSYRKSRDTNLLCFLWYYYPKTYQFVMWLLT